MAECVLGEQNPGCGGSPAGMRVTHLLVDWRGLQQSSKIPLKLRARPSRDAVAEMGGSMGCALGITVWGVGQLG